MKIAFVGPSLPKASDFAGQDIEIRRPAIQGDIVQAVRDGVTAIALIDGNYEYTAPIWHKEILFALSKSIPVIGAASMGALRAVECAPFGMIGCGVIHADYASGKRIDDGDVALLHGPEELDYPPITLPLVNLDATLEALSNANACSSEMINIIREAAAELNFRDRHWNAILNRANLDKEQYLPLLKAFYVNQKKEDAKSALEMLRSLTHPSPDTTGWHFNTTPLWRSLYNNLDG